MTNFSQKFGGNLSRDQIWSMWICKGCKNTLLKVRDEKNHFTKCEKRFERFFQKKPKKDPKNPKIPSHWYLSSIVFISIMANYKNLKSTCTRHITICVVVTIIYLDYKIKIFLFFHYFYILFIIGILSSNYNLSNKDMLFRLQSCCANTTCFEIL